MKVRALGLFLVAIALSASGDPVKVDYDAYAAVLDDTGALTVIVAGGPTLKVSLIRRWTFYQTPEYAKFARREKTARDNAEPVAFRIKYFWNGGEVTETVAFAADGFRVYYDYVPGRDVDVSYLTLLVEGDFAKGGAYRATTSGYDDGGIAVGAFPLNDKARYAWVSARKRDGLTIELVAERGAWLCAWPGAFGAINNGKHWEKTRYKANETYSVGLICAIQQP